MKIGELADEAGVNVQTIRYYERRGLLPEPVRRPSGYREYEPGMLDRLGFIRRAQELGFTLTEIGDLLALRLDPSTPANAVKERAEAKIADIDRKLHDLEHIRHALIHLAGRCRGGRSSGGDDEQARYQRRSRNGAISYFRSAPDSQSHPCTML